MYPSMRSLKGICYAYQTMKFEYREEAYPIGVELDLPLSPDDHELVPLARLEMLCRTVRLFIEVIGSGRVFREAHAHEHAI